jgi:hypothetical protein
MIDRFQVARLRLYFLNEHCRIVLVWALCHHQKVHPPVIGIHGYVILGGRLSCAEAQDSFSTYESRP